MKITDDNQHVFYLAVSVVTRELFRGLLVTEVDCSLEILLIHSRETDDQGCSFLWFVVWLFFPSFILSTYNPDVHIKYYIALLISGHVLQTSDLGCQIPMLNP